MLRFLPLLLLAPFPSDPTDPPPGGERTVPAWIHCTPTTVEVAGGEILPAVNAIARALEKAGPGSIVHLDPGTYPPLTIGMGGHSVNNARTSGGERNFPIVIDGHGAARIRGKGDGISIDQREPNGHITFKDLTIIPGERSGVTFYRQPPDKLHAGYSFEDVHILGGFNHETGQGPKSKWGVSAHSLSNFRFVGLSEPARIERIEKEHAFYIQNHRGSILIENVRAIGLGRAFCQFTARENEGPPGRGDITIRDCEVRDACISKWDGYKGGSAFTFAGRLDCTILLERNSYRSGFDKRFNKLTIKEQPYGTGALAAWQGKQTAPIAALILRDNSFRFAEGCGDRALVAIGGVDQVLIVGRNEFRSGGEQPALALDPMDYGSLISAPNGSIYLAPETKIGGPITSRGKPATEEQRAAWERRKTGR